MYGERVEIARLSPPPLVAGADVVLLADGDPRARIWLRGVAAGRFVLDEVSTGVAALDRIAAGGARLVIIGAQLEDMTGEALVARAAQWLHGDPRGPVVFLLANADGHCFDVDPNVPIFYRLVRGMPVERTAALLAQAASTQGVMPARDHDAALAASVAPYASAIGKAPNATDAAVSIVETVKALVGVDRVRCLFCDDATGALWSGTDETAQESRPAEGLVAFSMRTATCIQVPRAAADPMYRRELDDPTGDGDERLAIQPVVGPDAHVHAVIVAARTSAHGMFDATELARLEAFTAALSPYLMQLELQIEADAILGDTLERGPSDVFRAEAITAMVRRGARGDVVRVHPRWVSAAYWVVVAAVVAAVAFAALARVHEYTEGPAIVRYKGRNNVVAFEPGTIASLEVTRGQHVDAGQVLVRLHDVEQAGRLRGLETEFERKLVSYLQSPANPTVRQELAQIVSQREAARASVESRVIRAPSAGVVKEVMVHNGQHVDAGATMLSLAANNAPDGLTVLAFIPGRDRPRLHAHQMLHLTLPGYRGARIASEVRAISSEVLGANEARARYLGDRIGDSLPVTGTVVVVEAELATPAFEVDGRRFQLHEGMVGVAEVQLEARSLLQTFIPGQR